MRTLKVILTEIETNPTVQLAATTLTVVLVTVFVTVLAVMLSAQRQKR